MQAPSHPSVVAHAAKARALSPCAPNRPAHREVQPPTQRSGVRVAYSAKTQAPQPVRLRVALFPPRRVHLPSHRARTNASRLPLLPAGQTQARLPLFRYALNKKIPRELETDKPGPCPLATEWVLPLR